VTIWSADEKNYLSMFITK